MTRVGSLVYYIIIISSDIAILKILFCLKKLKMELPFDPAIPWLGLYPKNPETPIQKNLCTPMFIAAQFTIAKCWKQPKCPTVNE